MTSTTGSVVIGHVVRTKVVGALELMGMRPTTKTPFILLLFFYGSADFARKTRNEYSVWSRKTRRGGGFGSEEVRFGGMKAVSQSE